MSLGRQLFFIAIWAFLSSSFCAATDQEVYGGGVSSPNLCSNCTICQYPYCHPQPPPPSGYPAYAGPPPPPPPPPAAVAANCPPTSIVCCSNSTPIPYTPLPYDSYNGSALPMPFSIVWSYVLFLLLLCACA
ncbi:hypothetical protein NMG60_11035274 [Bertholletia excelsa]